MSILESHPRGDSTEGGIAKKPTDLAATLTRADHRQYAGATKVGENLSPGMAALKSANGSDFSIATVEKIQATSKDVNKEAAEGIESIKQDVLKGDKWSDKSIATWKRLFGEANAEPNATATSVLERMNKIGALFNDATGTSRVGMALRQDNNGTHYYMMLSKDPESLAKNRQTLTEGKESPTVVNIGTYGRKA
jgi:hypothetical protein